MFRVVNPKKTIIGSRSECTHFLKKKEFGFKGFLFIGIGAFEGCFFPTTWKIVHPIDSNSPLFDYKEQDVLERC